jgi:hypothetical protein
MAVSGRDGNYNYHHKTTFREIVRSSQETKCSNSIELQSIESETGMSVEGSRSLPLLEA